MYIPYDDPLIKSPTQTLAWLKCQVYWRESREKSPISDVILKGRELSKAIAARLKNEVTHTTLSPRLINVAVEGLDKYGTVISIEKPIGNCRPDCISLDYDSRTMYTIDHKYTSHCTPDQLSERFDNLSWKWQLRHYAYFSSQYFRHHITNNTKLKCVINLVTDNPKIQKWFYSWEEDVESLNRWLNNAVEIWKEISSAKNRNLVRNETQCIDKYGKCYFYNKCHYSEYYNEYKEGEMECPL